MGNKPKVSVKALIIKDSKLLTICKEDEDGYFYSFPGGGQEMNETLVEAVRRELLEEVGVEVEVGELLFVREFITRNYPDIPFDEEVHVVDHVFLCELPAAEVDFTQTLKTNPDPGQVRIEWLALAELENYRFYPRALIPYLQGMARGQRPPLYVGDIN